MRKIPSTIVAELGAEILRTNQIRSFALTFKYNFFE
jgi:hypothetical protein